VTAPPQYSRAEPPRQPKGRRRLARLLRWTAIGISLVLLVGLSWVYFCGRIQHEAVARIRAGGGSVLYDWQLHRGRYDPDHFLWQISIHDREGRPPWPSWVVALLGVDSLTDVKMADIGPGDPDGVMAYAGRLHGLEELTFGENTLVSDAGMLHLAGLKRLKTLIVRHGRLTGASLTNLSGLNKLQALKIAGIALGPTDLSALQPITGLRDLTLACPQAAPTDLDALRDLRELKMISFTKIAIDDLEPIRRLPNLLSLHLLDSQLDDAGLATLAAPGALPDLVGLYLVNTKITDAGLKTLRNLRRLGALYLEGSPITDAGLEQLAATTAVPFSLARTKITDAGLAILVAKRPELNAIDVSGTQITNAGLKHLERLRYLVELNLKGTRVTDSGVAGLRKIFPYLTIKQ
jgi:internalin A